MALANRQQLTADRHHSIHTPEEIGKVSVEILKPPRRNRKILPKFHFILPKFHFILPKFYFPAPWRIFICSLDIPDSLGRRVAAGGMHGPHLARGHPLCQSGTYNRCVKWLGVVVLTGTDALPLGTIRAFLQPLQVRWFGNGRSPARHYSCVPRFRYTLVCPYGGGMRLIGLAETARFTL